MLSKQQNEGGLSNYGTLQMFIDSVTPKLSLEIDSVRITEIQNLSLTVPYQDSSIKVLKPYSST